MDFSKLPRLSRTDTPPNDAGPDTGQAYMAPRHVTQYDRYMEEAPPGSSGVEIWMSLGFGLLFIFLGFNYGKHLFNVGNPYPAITGTGIVWSAGTPNEGQEVLPEELAEPHKTQYRQRIEGRRLGILSDSSLFLFGVAMMLDGVVCGVARVRRLPVSARQVMALAGICVTLGAVGYCLYVVIALWRADIMPLMTFVCVIVGGLMLSMQFALLRAVPLVTPRPREAPAAAPAVAPSRQVIAAALGAEQKARCTHYRFAHHALRQAALENPQRCVGLLQGPGAGKFLRELWDAVRRDCEASGQASGDDGADRLEADMTQVGPYTGAVVQLPPAKYKGEAQLVAMVLRSYTRADGSVVERHPLLLYYTLERTAGEDGAAKTVLCEWQAGDHVKYADAPSPDVSSFREAIQEKVNALQKREDEAALRGAGG